MQLIDEQNDLPFGFFHFLQYRFQTLFKLTSVFSSGDQSPHIQRKQFLVFQTSRYIAAHDTLRQPFYDSRLTDTRFTDQHRVVLGLTGQDTDHVTDLGITSDHRVQLLLPRTLHQVKTVFCQGIIGCFRIVRRHPLVAAHRCQRRQKPLSGKTVLGKQRFDLTIREADHGKHQMFHGNIIVSHRLCFVFRTDQHFIQIRPDPQITALYLHALFQCLFRAIHEMFRVDLHLLHKLQDQGIL